MPMKDFSYVNANLSNWVFYAMPSTGFAMNCGWFEKLEMKATETLDGLKVLSSWKKFSLQEKACYRRSPD